MDEPVVSDSVLANKRWPEAGTGKSIGTGMAVGTIVGAAAGYLTGKAMCSRCDDNGPIVVPTVLFAFVGGAIGGYAAHVSARRSSQSYRPDRSDAALLFLDSRNSSVMIRTRSKP